MRTLVRHPYQTSQILCPLFYLYFSCYFFLYYKLIEFVFYWFSSYKIRLRYNKLVSELSWHNTKIKNSNVYNLIFIF